MMMKTFPWVAAAAGVALAAYFLKNMPVPQHATGSNDVEDAARKTSVWGSKQRVTGKGRGLIGSLKQGVGRATGNQELQDQGAIDHIGGAVQDAAGELAQAAGQTLHDFNR
ncbi:Uncharacterized conserved protein YjbJ, UPF0337 family [Bryocella elongata]|uniref:Uncharacterized conserved protein YjbJ, UPF0337 family n=1 Tax=Bryocella elongata TaxID=863522 RepID=A0A1H5XRM9_9BACT|nr:CsbD family protein [Bryocella elongata]SEG14312.1 Uncharacterized conserved protein YjbJ, UPF0337 family [Bryocella elongata]